MKARTMGKSAFSPTSAVFKRSLLCIAIFSAMGSAHAQEQQQTADKEQEEAEVIEVRGIRASAAENLAMKRLSNSVLDAINAEDIGKFPDKNVADSLQRIPGVVIQRSGGEGSSVSIRGLSSDLTFTQLNGNFIASSPGAPSRSFSYELLPSNLVGRVEVYKSSEARLDEGGVGGTVIVHSRKPLDMESGSGAVNLEYTYADVTDKYEPQFSGIYSWKNEDENFGMLVGYTQQDRTNRTQTSAINIMNQNYEYSEMKDGQLVEGGAVGFAPQSFRQLVLEEDRERTGVQFTAQWAPTENFEMGINYFRFTLGLNSILHQLEYPEWHNNRNYWTDVRVDEAAEFVTGIDYSVGANGAEAIAQIPRINGEFVIEESTSDTFDIFAKYEGDSYSLDFVAGHTESEGGPTEKYRSAYYSGSNSQAVNGSDFWGWDFSGQQLETYMDPAMFTNLQNGIGGEPDIGATDSSFVGGTQEEDYAQLDLEYLPDWDGVDALRFGVKYRNGSIRRDTRNTFYLAKDFDVAAGEAAPGGITLEDDYSRNDGIPLITDVLADAPLGNLSDVINTNLFPAVDWHKYQANLNANFKPYTRFEPDYVYEVEEKIYAAYAQADYSWNKVRGNFGVRVVQTTTTSTASDRFEYRLDRTDDNGVDIPNDTAVQKEIVIVPKESKDTEVLPSFNIAWDINEDWVLRGAAAKLISRPGYSDLGQFQTLTYRSAEWASDSSARDDFNPERDGEGWTGSGGNSTLEPFKSTQMDISLEYYYGEGSGISLAVFHKNIDNFVVPLILEVDRNVPSRNFTLPNGQDVSLGGDVVVRNFSTSGNGSNAISKGMELAAQHFFDNGFGIYGNFTRNLTNVADVEVDGTKVGESPLAGSSKYQGNFSVFYENDLFSARISYNQRGPTIGGLNLSWEKNYYTDTYEQIDINGSYNITENLTLSASVINLTESDNYTHLGNDTKNRFISNSYSGRRLYAGVNYRF
ncbi:TonB-dependent receptor [uncultured Paraglaciecola sp.]|uniref:TonB-dependent receptor n=1 Tax=uncultured Paraglaciecola sp. TaxID=1765024 RepID=UPI00261014F6|nr:TonB-dependent receptor [uncultured Paraglaciecola sp.]